MEPVNFWGSVTFGSIGEHLKNVFEEPGLNDFKGENQLDVQFSCMDKKDFKEKFELRNKVSNVNTGDSCRFVFDDNEGAVSVPELDNIAEEKGSDEGKKNASVSQLSIKSKEKTKKGAKTTA